MAAGVSLAKSIEVFGHEKRGGTHTRELIAALRILGVGCDDRMRRLSSKRPVLPKRGIVAIHGPNFRPHRWHWMLTWDGQMLDPGGVWPDYKEWRITSYLEIKS